MKTIAGIELWKQAIGMLRVARDFVEVDQRVEVPGRSNPLVDRLPVRLAARSWVVVLRTGKGKQGSANHLDSVRVRAGHDLLVGSDHAAHQRIVFILGDLAIARERTQVVDSLKDNQVANARLR